MLMLACGMGGGEIPGWEIVYVREQMASGEWMDMAQHSSEKEVCSDSLQAAENHWGVFSTGINMIRFAF